jgi:3',5'-cyclic AMP phosphodiesterase CpdA
MIIAQISDTHIDPDHPNSAQRLRDMERVVAAINALDPAPDVVIHTGDMAHNGTAEKYEAALDILRNLRVPLHAAAGNRDDRALIRANFRAGRDLMTIRSG